MGVFVIKALLWTARRHSRYSTLNQPEHDQLPLATRAVHKRVAACFAVGGGIFESPFKLRSFVTWGQFHEVNLHVYLKFIGYYGCLFSCSISLNNLNPLL